MDVEAYDVPSRLVTVEQTIEIEALAVAVKVLAQAVKPHGYSKAPGPPPPGITGDLCQITIIMHTLWLVPPWQ